MNQVTFSSDDFIGILSGMYNNTVNCYINILYNEKEDSYTFFSVNAGYHVEQKGVKAYGNFRMKKALAFPISKNNLSILSQVTSPYVTLDSLDDKTLSITAEGECRLEVLRGTVEYLPSIEGISMDLAMVDWSELKSLHRTAKVIQKLGDVVKRPIESIAIVNGIATIRHKEMIVTQPVHLPDMTLVFETLDFISKVVDKLAIGGEMLDTKSVRVLKLKTRSGLVLYFSIPKRLATYASAIPTTGAKQLPLIRLGDKLKLVEGILNADKKTHVYLYVYSDGWTVQVTSVESSVTWSSAPMCGDIYGYKMSSASLSAVLSLVADGGVVTVEEFSEPRGVMLCWKTLTRTVLSAATRC